MCLPAIFVFGRTTVGGIGGGGGATTINPNCFGLYFSIAEGCR